jgi:uncharacterized Zn finger protein (UPF0148 family)
MPERKCANCGSTQSVVRNGRSYCAECGEVWVSQSVVNIRMRATPEKGVEILGSSLTPNDLTPRPLKMTAQERAAVSCPRCGASLMGAVIGRDGEPMCGMCGAPIWQDKDGKS